jgi:hypothetical protein
MWTLTIEVGDADIDVNDLTDKENLDYQARRLRTRDKLSLVCLTKCLCAMLGDLTTTCAY